MIDQRDIGAIFAVIGRLDSEVAMVQCMNQVLVELVSKLTGSNIEEVYKEVGARHAKRVLRNSKVYQELIQNSMDPDRQVTIEDLLKSFGDSSEGGS